jgi:acyl-CoA thioesterase-1
MSFMEKLFRFAATRLRPRPFRSYGKPAEGCHRITFQTILAVLAAIVPFALFIAMLSAPAQADRPLHIVALGDSLTAGYGLAASEAFPARLEAALRARGINVTVENAGVSGDTAAGGLARLDWSVPEGTDAVIVELGANDMLRGIDPNVTRAALASILERLKARGIAVLLCGMRAAPNMGAEYVRAFDAIFPDLASQYGVPLYPFFLDGVATQASFSLRDGMHPNAAGIDVIVAGILPTIEQVLGKLRK